MDPWSKAAAATPTEPTSSFDMKAELAKHGYGVEPETREPEVPDEYSDSPPPSEYDEAPPSEYAGEYSEPDDYDDEDETKHRSSPDAGERKRRS